MRKHTGMRPQDVPILLKILSFETAKVDWQMRNIAQELDISPSEVSESLNRSSQADLIDGAKQHVNKLALHEFLIHGLRYVFPQSPGPLVRGTNTAHSAPPLNKMIRSSENYVWPDAVGDSKGQAIEPLYPSLVQAAKRDPFLYQSLALIDALRVGRVREQNLAKSELEKMIVGNG
jgi:hypothetical protein